MLEVMRALWITKEQYDQMARLGVPRSHIYLLILKSLILKGTIKDVRSYIKSSLQPDGAFEEVVGKRILDM